MRERARLHYICLLTLVCSGACAFALENGQTVTFSNCNAQDLQLKLKSRGVNAPGGKPARWVDSPPTVPAIPSRTVVVTYSIVRDAAVEHVIGVTLTPIEDAAFVGADTLRIIREAAESWNYTCGITLQYVPSGGQIQIGSGGGAPGIAQFRRFGNPDDTWYITAAYVQISSTSVWTMDKLRLVVAHEVGHTIGIKHTDLTDALMYPITTTPATAPTPDDRWYAQSLYGAAPARLAVGTAASGVSLLIGKASPIQTGTNSDPNFDGSAVAPLGPGNGTGSQTQNNVLHYVVERKSDGSTFSIISATTVPGDGLPNANPASLEAANTFTFTDSPPDGTHVYRVKAVHETSGDDVYSREITVTLASGVMINQPPVIDSAASANPALTLPSDIVDFSIGARDPEGANLSVLWDFGDGSPIVSGASVQHSYISVGVYTVSVTISDGVNTISDSLQVEIVSELPRSLDVIKLLGMAKNTVVGRDTCRVQGAFPGLPLTIDPTGKPVEVTIGGVTSAFVLDVKGKAKSAGGQFKLTRRSNAPAPLFMANLKGAFAAEWTDDGVLFGAATGTTIIMPVMIRIDGIIYFRGVSAPLLSKTKTAKFSFVKK